MAKNDASTDYDNNPFHYARRGDLMRDGPTVSRGSGSRGRSGHVRRTARGAVSESMEPLPWGAYMGCLLGAARDDSVRFAQGNVWSHVFHATGGRLLSLGTGVNNADLRKI